MITFDRHKPYNELPSLPPNVDLETKKVMRKTISATRALANLNGALSNLPNPTLFLDTIHLQEAKASSEIENIITTNDDLYRSIVADKKFDNSAAKEVLNYKEAIWFGLKRLEIRPILSTNLFVELVQCIKKNTSGIRSTPGTTLANHNGEIIYTPPAGEEVIREKLADLEKFINDQHNLDPLIKMALLHYQFEAIHPFVDGNGRTGRILLLLYLKMVGLLDTPAIYLSEYIIRNKREYYICLKNVTEQNDWQGFVVYMLNMVEETATRGLERLKKVISLLESMSVRIKTKVPNAYSKDLMEILFRLPYTKRQHLIDAGLGTAKTVGNYLQDLEQAGFVKSVRIGKEKLYVNYQLMDILEK